MEEALRHVYGYAVGVDLTRRDLQNAAKALRRPWDAAKSFDQSAPCGAILECAGIAQPAGTGSHLAGECVMELTVNGASRQRTTLDLMIYSVAEAIHHLSREVTLCSGDLLFTGTPAGVGELQRGDHVECRVTSSDGGDCLPRCTFQVA